MLKVVCEDNCFTSCFLDIQEKSGKVVENPGGDCGWGDIKGPRVYILECLSC